MAVANFHYITRMNSGFKVYILEGQPSLRTEDRHRQVANERARLPLACPVKRKRSPGRNLPGAQRPGKIQRLPITLKSEQRAVFKNATCNLQRQSSLSPPRSLPPSPQNAIVTTTTYSPSQSPAHRLASPAHSPTDQWLSPVFDSPPMDEPLALIKKPKRDVDLEADGSNRGKPGSQVQMRPSVITCVTRSGSTHRLSEAQYQSSAAVTSPLAVVEEHFRRSLGVDYQKAGPRQVSVSVSVDDHFAKALGEKWLQLRASSSSSSCSSPPSSPLSSPSFMSSGAPSPCSPSKNPERGSEGPSTPSFATSSPAIK